MNLKDEYVQDQQKPCKAEYDVSNVCHYLVKEQTQTNNPSYYIKVNLIENLQKTGGYVQRSIQAKIEKQNDTKAHIKQRLVAQELKGPPIIKQNKLKLKPNRKRPTDHNICKKLHTIANKCLKHLGLYQFIQPQLQRIHKRNYFMFALIIADKAQQLEQFKQIYTLRINLQFQQYKRMLNELNFNQPESSHYIQLMNSIEASFECINLYQKCQLHSATLKLFNLQKLKRRSCIQQGFAEILLFSQKIEIEQVLTQ